MRDVAKVLFRDVSKILFRDDAKILFRDDAKLLFRNVAKILFRDFAKVLFRDVAKILFRDVASEMKLLLDSAARLAPLLPERQRQELDMARRKLLETSRSFSTALKGYFKEPQ